MTELHGDGYYGRVAFAALVGHLPPVIAGILAADIVALSLGIEASATIHTPTWWIAAVVVAFGCAGLTSAWSARSAILWSKPLLRTHRQPSETPPVSAYPGFALFVGVTSVGYTVGLGLGLLLGNGVASVLGMTGASYRDNYTVRVLANATNLLVMAILASAVWRAAKRCERNRADRDLDE